MEKVFENWTPHSVNVIGIDGTFRTFDVAGPAPRVSSEVSTLGAIDGIPIVLSKLGEPVGLPEPKEGVMFIVSQMLVSATPERDDLVFPTDIVRNEQGVILGCRAFARC
jgi:hypothetical protein